MEKEQIIFIHFHSNIIILLICSYATAWPAATIYTSIWAELTLNAPSQIPVFVDERILEQSANKAAIQSCEMNPAQLLFAMIITVCTIAVITPQSVAGYCVAFFLWRPSTVRLQYPVVLKSRAADWVKLLWIMALYCYGLISSKNRFKYGFIVSSVSEFPCPKFASSRFHLTAPLPKVSILHLGKFLAIQCMSQKVGCRRNLNSVSFGFYTCSLFPWHVGGPGLITHMFGQPSGSCCLLLK